MPAEYYTEDNILVIANRENITSTELKSMKNTGSEIACEKGLKFILIDLRKAILKAQLDDYFEFAKSLAKEFPTISKYALVLSPKTLASEDANFIETVAQNYGTTLKRFSEYDDAIGWLIIFFLTISN